MNTEKFVDKVVDKRELRGLSKEVVSRVVKEYFYKRKIKNFKEDSKEEKLIIKEIRNELRRYSGMFQNKTRKFKSWEDLLERHSSTRERKNEYEKVKKLIYSSKPRSILDLGCGINPIGVGKKDLKYYACDIREDELKLVKEYFKEKGISGKVFVCDLTQKGYKFPKVDLCLIFKVLDILGKNRVNLARKLLKKIDSKKIIISFPTITLSGKNMRYVKRPWLERILGELGWKFNIEKIGNELFYVIDKE